MGISLIALLMMTGSLSLRTIVAQQHGFWDKDTLPGMFFKHRWALSSS